MICPICNLDVEKLTRDHIVPKWLFNPGRLNMLGLRNNREKWGQLVIENSRKICFPCNLRKGGKMDYNDPVVRKFIRKMILHFRQEMDKYDPTETELKIECKCTSTPLS